LILVDVATSCNHSLNKWREYGQMGVEHLPRRTENKGGVRQQA